jgi:hypothetical protein
MPGEMAIAYHDSDEEKTPGEGAVLRHPTRGTLSRCAIRGAE